MQPTTYFQVDQWITQVQRLITSQRCNSPNFFRPHHFVTLAIALARAKTNELKLPESIQAYAARMKLWEAVGLEPPVAVTAHAPHGRFVPLVRLENRNNVAETADQLAEITATYGADQITRDAVRTSMMEIMDNCFSHAEITEQIQGIACAQSWPQGDLVQIAIADCGIGIRSSLSQNKDLHTRLESENSCELATELFVTSKPGRGHSGYGLALARQLLERAGGRLIVVSGSEWVQAYGSICMTGDLTTPFAGTLAVLEWKTNAPLRLKDVYESWPIPAGFDADDLCV